MNNPILKLFDKNYVIDLFNKRVLPLYPDFKSIKSLEIKTPKKYIWEETYHVVIEFRTTFLTLDNQEEQLSIYCSAHSDEPRRNVYKALKYLWDNNFSHTKLTIPRPLFYSQYFRGTFYRGVEGHNLYYYIRNHKRKEIKKIVIQAADWFAKLHKTKTSPESNFNPLNSRIETVIPGKEEIMRKIKDWYPEHLPFYEKYYNFFISQEEKFFTQNKERCLIHGDAHPENIIKISKDKIAVIDFTDICLADFTRDLGCFLQQLDFMFKRKDLEEKYLEKMKEVFLDRYFKSRKIKKDENIEKRIKNYYYWTAIRTATFFLIKDKSEPERAVPLIEEIKNNIKI